MRSPSMWCNRKHCWINLQKRKTTMCTNVISNCITASWTYVTCCTTALQPLQVCHQVQNLLVHQILMIAWSLPYSGKTQRTDKHLNSQWEELWRVTPQKSGFRGKTKTKLAGELSRFVWKSQCKHIITNPSRNCLRDRAKRKRHMMQGVEARSEYVSWTESLIADILSLYGWRNEDVYCSPVPHFTPWTPDPKHLQVDTHPWVACVSWAE